MFDFGRGSALDPTGESIALPKTHNWIYGGLLLTEYKSLTKNDVVFHSGKLIDGHCYHDVLKYT